MASTRYSTYLGSDAGGLTSNQRERIELWNSLSTIEESLTHETPPTSDPSLYVGSPPPSEVGKASHGNDDDDDESSDGSDLESDLLKIFEALAQASFSSRNYSKAEKFLQMAVERSTGDKTDAANFKSLRLRLALCCCLQEKWDHAAGIVASLPKTRTASNLVVFHLLQAISLAHLEESRCDFAYDVCKSALSGKKKILGRTHPDYYGCLAVFAAICEKRGNALEAEAVRHSIPDSWLARWGASVLSPTEYILQHETLIRSVFPGTIKATTTNDPRPLPMRPGTVSSRADDVQTPDQDDEGSKTAVKLTDTAGGEESLGGPSTADPSRVPSSPAPPAPVVSSPSAAQSRQSMPEDSILGRPDIPDSPTEFDIRPPLGGRLRPPETKDTIERPVTGMLVPQSHHGLDAPLRAGRDDQLEEQTQAIADRDRALTETARCPTLRSTGPRRRSWSRMRQPVPRPSPSNKRSRTD